MGDPVTEFEYSGHPSDLPSSQLGNQTTDPNPEQKTDQQTDQQSLPAGHSASATRNQEQTHKFVVRLPMPLRDRIAQAAKYYRRSMNSEIVARLEQSFQGLPSQAAADQLAPQMHEVMQNVFAKDLTDDEETMLRAFRRLPAEKQRSLLFLLS